MLTKADDATPISAYLDMEQIIQIAQDAHVDAIHPGYGFLSESPEFATACKEAGITFVGPTVENLNTFSDKTCARAAAIAAGVPVVPGSDGALHTAEEVTEFVKEIGLPIIIKVRMCCCGFICEQQRSLFRKLTYILLFPLGIHGRRRQGYARGPQHGGLGAIF